jgi:hypothetical protein
VAQNQSFLLKSSTQEEMLAAIGITAADLNATVVQIYRAFAAVGPLHPKGFSGTNSWADGTQAIRATMVPKGWKIADPNGQPRIVSPGGRYAITVSSGNPNTGNPNKTPQTKNSKGSQTSRSVAYNSRQGELFVNEPQENVISVAAEEQMLWFLLYYVDIEGKEVRYELSCPITVGDNDKVDGWAVRIIMPALRLGGGGLQSSDPGQTIDIPVKPKT